MIYREHVACDSQPQVTTRLQRDVSWFEHVSATAFGCTKGVLLVLWLRSPWTNNTRNIGAYDGADDTKEIR